MPKLGKKEIIGIVLFISVLISVSQQLYEILIKSLSIILSVLIMIAIGYLLFYIVWSIHNRLKTHKSYKDNIDYYETLKNNLEIECEETNKKIVNLEQELSSKKAQLDELNESIDKVTDLCNNEQAVILTVKLQEIQAKIDESQAFYEHISSLGAEAKKQLEEVDRKIESKNKELDEIESKIINWKNSDSISLHENMYNKNIQAAMDELESLKQQISDKYNELDKLNNSSATADIFTDIKKYKELLDKRIITQEEFDQKKKELLNL